MEFPKTAMVRNRQARGAASGNHPGPSPVHATVRRKQTSVGV